MWHLSKNTEERLSEGDWEDWEDWDDSSSWDSGSYVPASSGITYTRLRTTD